MFPTLLTLPILLALPFLLLLTLHLSSHLRRLARIQHSDRNLVIDEQLREIGGFDRLGLPILLSLEEEEGSGAFVAREVAACKEIVGVAIGLVPPLNVLVGQHRPMHIKMDHMIIAPAIFAVVLLLRLFEMIDQSFIRAGADDINIDRQLHLTQRLD